MSDFQVGELNPRTQSSPAQLPIPFSMHGQIEATLVINSFNNTSGSAFTIPKESLVVETDNFINVSSNTTKDVDIPTGVSTVEIPVHNIENGAYSPGAPFTIPYFINPVTGVPFVYAANGVTIPSTVSQEILSILRRYNMLDVSHSLYS